MLTREMTDAELLAGAERRAAKRRCEDDCNPYLEEMNRRSAEAGEQVDE